MMRPRILTYLRLMGLILVGTLMAAQGRIFAATSEPLAVATDGPSSPPDTAWHARELDPIIIDGGWGGVVRVWVRGHVGLPVTIRSACGGWSSANFVGTKPEYGPDALEFAPIWPGRYIIAPQGLDVSYTLDLAPGHIAQVIFEPADTSTTSPTPTSFPSSSLSPTPAGTPSPYSSLTPSPSPTSETPTLSAPVGPGQAPSLLEPPDGTAVSLKIRLDLAWTWEGTLGPDDYFQVEIWNSRDNFTWPIDVAWVKVPTYYHDSSVNPSYGPEYRWRITVVRGTPAREKDWSTPENQVWEPSSQLVPISQESETWDLFIDEGCPPGDRSC